MSLQNGWENAGKMTRFEHELQTYFNDNRHGPYCALLVAIGYRDQYMTVKTGFNPYQLIESINQIGLCGPNDYLIKPQVVLALDLLSPKEFHEQIPWKPGIIADPYVLNDYPVILLPPQEPLHPAMRHHQTGQAKNPAPGFIRGVIDGGLRPN